MAYSDPYEEWKAGGRRGPQPGASAPPQGVTTPPAPAPPPPNAAPRNSSFNPDIPAPYTPPRPAAPPQAPAQPAAPAGLMDYQTWFNQAQANAGQTWNQNSAENKAAYEAYKYRASNPNMAQGGMADDLATEQRYAASGDPTGMRAYARANGMSEDFDRFDNATLTSWESQKSSGCPPKTPYMAYDGSGCVEKPIDSNRPQGGGGGGGGAGGPGGGGVGAGGAGGPGGFGDMNEWWKNQIMSSTSRYSPEAMAALEADSFARARRQEKLQLDAANRDMAERGVRGSAYMNTVKRDISAKTSGQIASDRANLMRAKIDADYQDKQAAIKNAEAWVNSMRDYLLRTDANAIQRAQIEAQIRLATMNINAQKDMLEQQYRNNLNTTILTGGL